MDFDVSFLGPSTPVELAKSLPILRKIDQKEYKPVSQKVLYYLKGNEITEKDITSLSFTDQSIQATLVFTGLFFLLRAAIRSRTKIDQLQKDLVELKLPEYMTTDIVQIVQKYREEVETSSYDHRIRFAALDEMKWRIDVAISTGSLIRVMNPTVLMQMKLTDGSIKTFEVSVDKLNELRYNVARVLKDIEDIEKNPILKL